MTGYTVCRGLYKSHRNKRNCSWETFETSGPTVFSASLQKAKDLIARGREFVVSSSVTAHGFEPWRKKPLTFLITSLQIPPKT